MYNIQAIQDMHRCFLHCNITQMFNEETIVGKNHFSSINGLGFVIFIMCSIKIVMTALKNVSKEQKKNVLNRSIKQKVNYMGNPTIRIDTFCLVIFIVSSIKIKMNAKKHFCSQCTFILLVYTTHRKNVDFFLKSRLNQLGRTVNE